MSQAWVRIIANAKDAAKAAAAAKRAADAIRAARKGA